MRIPNKFNGYMSDGRRLYPDPATSAIIASSLAKGAAATTAATTAAAGLTAAGTAAAAAAPTIAGASAIPGIVGSAAPTLSAAAPAATTAAQGLGAAQAMSPEIAANMVQSQAANQGIMNSAGQLTGAADQTAALGANQINAANMPANQINTLSQGVTPPNPASPTGPQSGLPTGTQSPVGLRPAQFNATADQAAMGQMAQDQALASKVGAEYEAAQAAEKYASMNPLEKGFTKAKEFAGDVGKFTKEHPYITQGGIMLAQNMMQPSYGGAPKKKYSGSSSGSGGDFKYNEPSTGTYTPIFEPTPYAVGGPVEQMSAQNAVGANTMYPQSQLQTAMYSNPMVQRPMPTNVINPSGDVGVDRYSSEMRMATGGSVNAFEKMAKEEEARRKREEAQARDTIEEGKSIASRGIKPYSRTQTTNSPYAAAVKELQALSKKYGIKTAMPEKTNVDLMGDQDQIEYAANGGIMHGLGGYSDGGRLLKGPGDGVSDSIPAVIGNKQPARLADGEFVIPARIVSELGNGSTEAGARKLYAMMERVQKRRGKTVGKGKVAVNSKADKHLPA
jgi:hypothetical protein